MVNRTGPAEFTDRKEMPSNFCPRWKMSLIIIPVHYPPSPMLKPVLLTITCRCSPHCTLPRRFLSSSLSSVTIFFQRRRNSRVTSWSHFNSVDQLLAPARRTVPTIIESTAALSYGAGFLKLQKGLSNTMDYSTGLQLSTVLDINVYPNQLKFCSTVAFRMRRSSGLIILYSR